MIKSMAFKDEKRACHRFNICVGYCLPLISTGALFFKKIPFLTDMTLRLDGWVSLKNMEFMEFYLNGFNFTPAIELPVQAPG